jgi:hypothetical protein
MLGSCVDTCWWYTHFHTGVTGWYDGVCKSTVAFPLHGKCRGQADDTMSFVRKPEQMQQLYPLNTLALSYSYFIFQKNIICQFYYSQMQLVYDVCARVLIVT